MGGDVMGLDGRLEQADRKHASAEPGSALGGLLRLALGLGACIWAAAASPGVAATGEMAIGSAVVEYSYREKAPAATDTTVDGPSQDVAPQTSALRLDVEGDKVLISFPAAIPSESEERLPWRLLYLGARRTLVLLDDAERTFQEVDVDILVVLEQHLEQQDTDRRIRLLQMPAVPRRLMADVLAEEEAARARRLRWSPWEVESTGRWARQQDYRSLAYGVSVDGTPLGELWVAEVDSTALDAEVLVTLRQASMLIDRLLTATSEMATSDSLSLLGFEANPLAIFAFQRGLPVVLRRIVDGTVKYEKILRSIRPRQSDDDPVEVPEGYRRVILGLDEVL